MVGLILACATCPEGDIELNGQCIEATGADTMVSAGAEHWCAVSSAGGVHCGGDDSHGQAGERTGDVVTAGARHTCALDGDRVICWGERVEVPEETGWDWIDAGDGWTCGRSDDGVDCWGGPDPELEVVTVDVGAAHACGLTEDLGVHCWGDAPQGAPDGEFAQVVAGDGFGCATDLDEAVTCWGSLDSASSESFVQISAGAAHACGVTTDADVVCWGDDTHDQASPPVTAWRQVSAGGTLSCGLTASGHTTCWGADIDPEEHR